MTPVQRRFARYGVGLLVGSIAAFILGTGGWRWVHPQYDMVKTLATLVAEEGTWDNPWDLQDKKTRSLEADIEALLTDEYSKSSENKLKAIFGQVGVDAWMASLPETKQMAPLLKGLVASSGIEVSNPRVATPVGRNTRTLA